MRYLGILPDSSLIAWNECVIVQNDKGPTCEVDPLAVLLIQMKGLIK
jgi:hypothetical protein